MAPVVTVAGLRKEYVMGNDLVYALRGVDLTVESGEFVAVMGPSGSGKSTFMHVVGLLDTPTHGTYRFEGGEVSRLTSDERADIRGRRLGFIFQAYNLLSRTSALENVELPMVYAGVPEAERERIAREKLEVVGVPQLASHHPNQMSGGQQQRVAIARALVNNPGLILADEPTGALDSKSSQDIMRLFARLNKDRGITIVLVTHEPDVAAYARRIVTFRDGLITGDTVNERRAA
jgi:putative ABC transport system ATP-binding protein